jgi:hypothetical protein
MKKILSLFLTNFLVFTSNLSFADDINICFPENFHICAYTGCKTVKIKYTNKDKFIINFTQNTLLQNNKTFEIIKIINSKKTKRIITENGQILISIKDNNEQILTTKKGDFVQTGSSLLFGSYVKYGKCKIE